ncbi:MAG TPA: RluA family pseudouridine synthase [Phycisphaerales bacterium]|nr:RluA family pseudouridine synthase [Phycisphaerales bacterium]
MGDQPLSESVDSSGQSEDANSDIEMISQEGDESVGEHLTFRVGNNLKFRRLDKYLGGRFNQFSRSRLQKLIKEQGVNVNGRSAKPSHKLNAGDEIDLILPPREIREIIPEDIPINVIFEDDEMIVINKQANLIVHPARSHTHGTLVNGLVYYFKDLSSVNGDLRPGIVHRLDRNTTGVMCVAKTDHAHWKLSRQFSNRTVSKTYIAIVHGVPELTADCINKPLGVHPRMREKYAVRADGKPSVSYYEVIEEFAGYSLVRLKLETGRTHQLRVHMQYIKHSIVADDMYGGKAVYDWQIENREPDVAEPLMGRVALHAWRLEIKHPTTDELLKFEAPMPEDMLRLLDKLREFRKI